MSNVLYRKYRSQSFDELIGQGHITDILKNAVRKDMISHAYLFVGSRGTGKTSTARILAKALNCKKLQADGNPCSECENCHAIAAGSFLDLIEVDAASNRGIDQIRDLKEKIEFAPTEGRFKVYIIDEVHMLTTEAFNALLKTLEEPPDHIVFILATTDVHKLPATILSRCQRYDFRLGTDEQVRSVIQSAASKESVNLSAAALQILVQNANGSYRDALSLLDVVVSGQLESKKPDEVSEGEVRAILGIPDSSMVNHLIEVLGRNEYAAAFDLIEELDSRGVNLQQFVKSVLEELRKILSVQLRGSANKDMLHVLSPKTVLRYINLFLDAEKKLRTASIPTLVLEILVAEIATSDPTGSTVSVSKQTQPAESSSTGRPIVGGMKHAVKKIHEDGKNANDKVISVTAHSPSLENKDGEVEVVEQSADGSGITFDDIKNGWEKFISSLQSINAHLCAFVKGAKIIGLESGYLNMEVPFMFHKERIEAARSRDMISDAQKQVYGKTFGMRCSVNSTVKKKRAVSADVVLKNIIQPAPLSDGAKAQSQATVAPGASDVKQEVPARPRALDKKLEEIFGDM